MDELTQIEKLLSEVEYLTRVVETSQAGSLTHVINGFRLEDAKAELQALDPQCKVPA